MNFIKVWCIFETKKGRSNWRKDGFLFLVAGKPQYQKTIIIIRIIMYYL